MPSRRFPLLWLQRYGHTNAVRVFGALVAVVVVVILAGLAWLWVFGGQLVATGSAPTASRRFPPPWWEEGGIAS